MELTQAIEIERLVEAGRLDEARQRLEAIATPDLRDPVMWALVARLATTAERRESALRKVFNTSDNIDLANWALKELSALAEHGEAQSVSRPPLALLEAAKPGQPSIKTPFSVRVVRTGMASAFLGLIGFLVLNQVQTTDIGMVDGGARYLVLPLRLSGILMTVSFIMIAVGLCNIVVGVIMTFLPRRTR